MFTLYIWILSFTLPFILLLLKMVFLQLRGKTDPDCMKVIHMYYSSLPLLFILTVGWKCMRNGLQWVSSCLLHLWCIYSHAATEYNNIDNDNSYISLDLDDIQLDFPRQIYSFDWCPFCIEQCSSRHYPAQRGNEGTVNSWFVSLFVS